MYFLQLGRQFQVHSMQLSIQDTIKGKSSVASGILYIISIEYIVTGQVRYINKSGELNLTSTILYTTPVCDKATLLSITLINTTSSDVSENLFYIKDNQIIGGLTIPANGTAIYKNYEWAVYDSNGIKQSSGGSSSSVNAATQGETNTGTLTDVYVSPSTFTNASKWATKQDIDSDLTAIAALTTTSFGRGLLTETNSASLKTTISLNNVVNLDTSTTSNISDSTNKRFVTDANLVVIGNTSGTNTGDNTTNTTSNTYADGKVADAINDSITTIAPSQNAVFDALVLKANLASPTFTGTVSGVTSTMVGLGNVDNTSDVNKPVSTAQQTALNLKSNIASPTFTGTVTSPALVLSSETASTIASFDGSKNIKSLDVATYPSLTELSYVKGVTSAIQTQLTGKVGIAGTETITGTKTFSALLTGTASATFSGAGVYVTIGTSGTTGVSLAGLGVADVNVSTGRIRFGGTAGGYYPTFIAGGTEGMRLDTNLAVSIGSAANATTSSILDLTSTTKGLLIPRMTTTQRDAISSPATGLIVHNTTLTTRDTYDGTRWTNGAKFLSNTATLDFGSVASLGNAVLTITVTGAADGDPVMIGVPNGSMTAGLVYTAWVSATNTVSIQVYNSTIGAIDPSSGTFKATVSK